MHLKILCLFIIFASTGCKSLPDKDDKSFFIPFFNEIIEYENQEDDTNFKKIEEKEYMLLIMKGQIEINKGNNEKGLEYFEDSLLIKYSDISYTILRTYFKEKNYSKVKEMSELISLNGISKDSNKIYENIIIHLIDNNQEEYIKLIESLISEIKGNDLKVTDLYKSITIYKNIADIFIFADVNPIINKDLIKKEDFTLIEFFYKYNLSNKKGEEPDEALNYLILNKLKNNLLHNIAIFRIGDIENYHIDVYKDEATFIINNVVDYDFELLIMEKFYNHNKVEYEKLKTKLILKHKDNYNFWYFLSDLEKKEIDKSLFNIIKSYELIKKNNEPVQTKEIYINKIINLKIQNNDFDIKHLIEEYEDEKDKVNAINYLTKEMIINNNLDYNYLISIQPLIKSKDINLIIAINYYYFERYNKALSYISKSEEENSNIEDVKLLKILILGEKNKLIGLNEAEIYNKENESTASRLLLLHMRLKNNIDIESGYLELNNIKEKDEYTTFLKYRYAYSLKKYNHALEAINTIEIKDNYLYLVDYGKILLKLNKKEDAIKAFKDSKIIYNSLFLKQTIEELNIKKGII